MANSRTDSPGVFSAQALQRALTIFLPAALLTGCVVLALYYKDRASERALYEQAGTHLVDLQADIISREIKSVESDLLYLANQAVLRNYLSGAAASQRELEEEYRLFCRQRGVYDQIRYLDAFGQERIRINYHDGHPEIVPSGELQSKAGRYYFTQAMLRDRGEVFVSPFDLNVEHEEIERPLKPTIRFATPVFDKEGVKRGVVVLNYLGSVLLHKLAEVAVSFPGSALLLNQDGYFLRGPAPEDEWGFMLGHQRTFRTYFPDEWPSLVGNPEGQFRTSNGLFTFRTLSSSPPNPPQGQAAPLGPLLASSEADDRGAKLRLVSHIPPSVLSSRATVLLHRLLMLYGVVLVVLLGLAWYLGYTGALRRSQGRRLAESEGRLRALSMQLISAQEVERRSLSRDLHDELGQVVTAITLDLQRAAQAGDPEKKNELIGRALHGSGRLLDQIHEISTRQRPTLLDDLGLRDAVQSFLGEYEHHTGIVPRAQLCFDHDRVSAVVSENVFRILQEALTNVSKHSRSPEVFVDLHVATGRVDLTVRDVGVGFAPEALDGKRLGLLGMRERAELLNGSFVLQAEPGKGTEIRVTLPLLQATAHQPEA
jgi:signal transduction histidine kinase